MGKWKKIYSISSFFLPNFHYFLTKLFNSIKFDDKSMKFVIEILGILNK